MPNFEAMASIKTENLPKPRELPRGTYIWQVDSQPEIKRTPKGLGDMINFRMKLVRPITSFENPDELADYRKELGDVKGTIMTKGFYIPDTPNPEKDETQEQVDRRSYQAMDDIVKFLNHLGAEGEDTKERLSNCIYHQVLVTVDWEKDFRDQTKDRARLGAAAPLSSDE